MFYIYLGGIGAPKNWGSSGTAVELHQRTTVVFKTEKVSIKGERFIRDAMRPEI